MIIPADLHKRETFLDDVIQQCEQSAMDRLTINTALRNYCLFGTNDMAPGVKYNKIWPTIDLLSSFLYGQEGVQFSIKFGVGVPKEQAVYAETMRAKAREIWTDTGTDNLFGQAVQWALVYNSAILKTTYNGGLRTYMVYPHMIGVYREDIPTIDDQEAITHLYYTTKSALRTQLKICGEKKIDAVMDRVSSLGPITEDMAPGTVTQLILQGQIGAPGGVTGVVNRQVEFYNYRPTLSPELVEMREVWVWDDELEDYRVLTRANPNVIIFDRPGKQVCHKGEHPFVKITPYPLPDYFWGVSMVQQLIGLQDWRESHTERVDMVFKRILRPSRVFTGPGWGQLTDEKMLALDRPGGTFNSNVPGSKVDTYKPDVDLAQALAYLKDIDEKFNETAGLGGNIMRAQGDEGVRSMQHAQVLARMGSARIKKAALSIEDPAEKQITLMLKMEQEHDKEKYLDEQGNEFLLSQVTDKYSIKVSGHSLSPVFIEDTKQQAEKLVAMRAMSRERYIDETQPPMAEELKHDLKTKIEPSEAAAEKAKQGVEFLKVASKFK